MANLSETLHYDEGVYQFETSDPVEGGADGIDNKPLKNLANRTAWLKNQIESHATSTDAHQQYVTSSEVTTIITTNVKDASTTIKGIVELATAAEVIAGTSTALAITPFGLSSAITNLNYVNYQHPSVNHIPTGGADGQYLGWNSNGTAGWVAAPASSGGVAEQSLIKLAGINFNSPTRYLDVIYQNTSGQAITIYVTLYFLSPGAIFHGIVYGLTSDSLHVIDEISAYIVSNATIDLDFVVTAEVGSLPTFFTLQAKIPNNMYYSARQVINFSGDSGHTISQANIWSWIELR
jgi:hypothetical protein